LLNIKEKNIRIKMKQVNSLERPIIEYGRGKDGNTIPLEISYSVWGERQNPLITATVKDMR
jgi:hypothetical protein